MLKKILIGLLILVLLAGGYFLSIMSSTGFFRTIENQSWGEVHQEISLKGAEDFTIDYENELMIISAFDRAGERREEAPTGGLYVMDLSSEFFEPIRLDDGLGQGFHPHGIGLLKMDSTTYQLLVVNHQNGNHTIEQFELRLPDHLAHIQTFDNEMIVSPNDAVWLDEKRFYFTNDHKNTKGIKLIAENYLGLPLSNVVYYNGDNFSEAAGGIQYANGINIRS